MYQQSTARLHEHFRYRVDRVGQEGEPVLVIDNFLANAESLVNYAARFGQFQLAGPGYHSGYEFVDHSRLAHYRATLETEVKQQGDLPARYMNGSTPLFEQIAEYGAVFNRILIYPCTSLHSGNIPDNFVFDTDPRRGRLSINTFIFCRD